MPTTPDVSVAPTDTFAYRPVDARLLVPTRIPAGGGVAALVDGRQVAVFRTDDGRLQRPGQPRSLHRCPRPLPWDRRGARQRGHRRLPLRKQRFDLATGACLDHPEVAVAVHAIRLVGDHVEVRPTP